MQIKKKATHCILRTTRFSTSGKRVFARVLFALVIGAQPTLARQPAAQAPISNKSVSPFFIAERGPNYRVWKSVVTSQNAKGKTIYRTNSFTELATGLNQRQNGQWMDANDTINLASDGSGAFATNSQHQVAFSANLNVAGAISVAMPQRGQLQSSVLGLRYEDPATGQNVSIANVTDSTGMLLSTLNQVIYTNALTDSNSSFYADVLYSHHRNAFEQDVILREQPPAPEQFGLNSSNTLLQVWTEFFNAPEPTISTNWRTVHMGPGNEQPFFDEKLDFGPMQMRNGNAFPSENTNAAESAAMGMKLSPVSKHWVHYQGRTFLVEEVPFLAIVPQLSALPPSTSSNAPASSNQPQSFFRVLPRQERVARAKTTRMTLAKADIGHRPGLLMDYNLINATETNFTFQSDTTYYLSGENDLFDTTTIEGGAVLKCGPSSSSSAVVEDGINWLTSSYRPAIFTCTNDNSVGTPLTTNGNPTLTVTTDANWLQGGSIHNVRFSYAWNAFAANGTNVDISDCQFVDCDHPISVNSDTTNLALHNVLITMDDAINNSDNFCRCPPGALVIYSQALRCYGEHVTADLGSQNFITYFATLSNPSNTTVALTNSIVLTPHLNPVYASGGSWVGYNVSTNFTYYAASSPGTLFQSVGAGNYYLASDSPCRGAGTSNILSTTLADIQQKTTYPPVVIPQGYLTNNLNLSPEAQRDSGNAPDLGYHYDPLDFAFGGVLLSTNLNVTVNPGTAIGCFGTNGYTYGLAVRSGSSLICQGACEGLIHIAEYNTVQESSSTNWNTPSLMMVGSWNDGNSVLNFLFTDFSVVAQDAPPFDYPGSPNIVANLQNCQLHGGTINSSLNDLGMNLTNCLFERVNANVVVDFEEGGPTSLYFRNNLFWGGTFQFYFTGTNGLVQDNMFYQTDVMDQTSGSGSYAYGYNGFYGTSNTFLLLTNATDKFLTNDPGYEVGALGNYYLPTNNITLIEQGSTNANLLGLYQYCITTNQVKEGTNTVSIGYHYVALGTDGLPADTNNDGIPDYLSDANGNGLIDSGEIGWNVSGDLGLNVIITHPQNNSILP